MIQGILTSLLIILLVFGGALVSIFLLVFAWLYEHTNVILICATALFIASVLL